MFPGLTELHLIGCLIELIWTLKSKIKYIDTQNQLADIPTKGNFTRDEWNDLLCLFNISHFSSNNCLEVTSKRTQEDTGEERVTAKSRPMMSLIVSAVTLSKPMMSLIARVPSNVSSSNSESPRNKSYESQSPWSAKAEKNDRTGATRCRP